MEIKQRWHSEPQAGVLFAMSWEAAFLLWRTGF